MLVIKFSLIREEKNTLKRKTSALKRSKFFFRLQVKFE